MTRENCSDIEGPFKEEVLSSQREVRQASQGNVRTVPCWFMEMINFNKNANESCTSTSTVMAVEVGVPRSTSRG